MTDTRNPETEARRRLLKSIAAGGTVTSFPTLPDKWTAPIVDTVLLPAHAQTTAIPCPPPDDDGEGPPPPTNGGEPPGGLDCGDISASLTPAPGGITGCDGAPVAFCNEKVSGTVTVGSGEADGYELWLAFVEGSDPSSDPTSVTKKADIVGSTADFTPNGRHVPFPGVNNEGCHCLVAYVVDPISNDRVLACVLGCYIVRPASQQSD